MIDTSTIIAGVTMFTVVVMALVVGFIVLAVLLPIMDIGSTIRK